MKPKISEDILTKYILGEASPKEKELVDEWLEKDADNANHFSQLELILASGKRVAQESPLTEAAAWENFNNYRTSKVHDNGKVHKIGLLSNASWLQIAAAIIVLIGGGWMAYYFTYQQSSDPKWVNLTATKTVRIATLPDGTMIHINRNSTVSYRADFKSQRILRLSGEAFFEVTHNERNPFVVQTNDLLIKDIGTAFNVKTSGHNTEVIVESGIVTVSKGKSLVRLNANDRLSVTHSDKNLKVLNSNDQLYQYYRTKKIIANHTPLSNLAAVLSDAYGASINIQNKALSNTPITATFRLDDSLENVLKVLKETTPDIVIERSGAEIILR
jgi:transmembrane sensor